MDQKASIKYFTHILFDFFLFKCSLSTTSSFQVTFLSVGPSEGFKIKLILCCSEPSSSLFAVDLDDPSTSIVVVAVVPVAFLPLTPDDEVMNKG